jgi:hypothetical protein
MAASSNPMLRCPARMPFLLDDHADFERVGELIVYAMRLPTTDHRRVEPPAFAREGLQP